MSDTPETDKAERMAYAQEHMVPTEVARKLERERDEAREALADWENAADHVEANHPDEVHCGCVPVLRKLLADARKERDEARDIGERLSKQGLDMMDENRSLKRERDEAREALAEAWRFADQWMALADGYLKRINEIQNDIRKN